MAVYNYHPSTPLLLGAGVDPKDPLNVIPSCISYDEHRIEKTAVTTEFSLSLLRTRRDLYEKLNISASMSAHYLFFSADGSLSIDRDYSFESDTIVWILKAYTDFGRKEARHPELLPEAQALVTSDPDEFSRRYGTEVILQERRAVQIVAIFSLSNMAERQKDILQRSFRGGISLRSFGADVAANYSKFVSEAAKVSSLNVSVYALGGGGISNLADIIQNQTDIDVITDSLQQYTSNFNFDSSAPIQYLSGSMSRFGWRGNPIDITYRDQVLSDLYILYKDIQAVKDRLQYLTSSSPDSPLGKLITAEQRNYYREVLNEYYNRLRSIQQSALACRLDEQDCPNIVDLMPSKDINWPELPQLPRILIDRYTTGLKRSSDGGTYYSVDVSGQIIFDWEAGDLAYWLVNGARSNDITPIMNNNVRSTKTLDTDIKIQALNTSITILETETNLKSVPFTYNGIRVPVLSNDNVRASLALEVIDRFGRKYKYDVFKS